MSRVISHSIRCLRVGALALLSVALLEVPVVAKADDDAKAKTSDKEEATAGESGDAKATSTESAELLELMDHRYGEHHFTAKLGTGYRKHLKMKPSEYFKRNIRVGSSAMSRREAELRHTIGLETIMWGTDYPHPEGTWPITRKIMVDTFKGLPDEDIEAMLGGNAASFYGFDTEKLLPLAARIGPERSWFR